MRIVECARRNRRELAGAPVVHRERAVARAHVQARRTGHGLEVIRIVTAKRSEMFDRRLLRLLRLLRGYLLSRDEQAGYEWRDASHDGPRVRGWAEEKLANHHYNGHAPRVFAVKSAEGLQLRDTRGPARRRDCTA